MALVHSFIWPSMADLITLKGLRRTQSPGVFEKKKNDKKTTPTGILRSNPFCGREVIRIFSSPS